MNKKLAEARRDKYLHNPRRIERQERETRGRNAAAGLTLKRITEALASIRQARAIASPILSAWTKDRTEEDRKRFAQWDRADSSLSNAELTLTFLVDFLKGEHHHD